MNEFHQVRAVVLAGGSGTRLWPLSRLQAPKQFLRLLGDESLLEATISRLDPIIGKAQVIVVTNQETASGDGYRALLPYARILEPVARNTAPAIGVAALRFLLQGVDALMVVLPSDHLILDVSAFQAALAKGIEAANEGKLITFGIRPTAPETGFGYIQAESAGVVRKVRAFHEKPDRERAESFVASGTHFWNSGMFVWRASAIVAEIERSLPELARVLDAIREDVESGTSFEDSIRSRFAAAPSISIDHGVLEKSERLFMIPGDFGWSDVGNWDAVYDVAEKDAQLNALQGNVVAIDCHNTLIRSHKRLVAAVGVEDISIIETPDAVLVAPRGGSQDVRKVVEELARRSSSEHVVPMTVQRPWGRYTVLEEAAGFKLKRIEVLPGARLSLQSHAHRSEHWVVIEGVARVTCGERTFELNRNESTFVPIGARHRLENPGESLLSIIEVQVGETVDEADIIRYDDQYGR